ncbi:MAG: UDP-N-acetylmuramate dehydrogenase [Candidatus Omnitrophica bacterium]|nr:UDP-N-acetylmuramate dehydrogenase [Candidatus Omnitrophota bacterium]
MLRREYGKLLSRHTTLKIGGPVFCWLEPENIGDLLDAIKIAKDTQKDLAIIGGGSNILASEQGFGGIAVYLGRGFDSIEKEGEDVVKVGAGVPLALLVKKAAEWRLAGCEFLAGIPGSFGGALFMNAGARDTEDPETMREVKDIVVDVEVINVKNIKKETLSRKDILFAYRSSGLDGKCVVSGRLKLNKDGREIIENRTRSFIKKREWIEKIGFPSAGSVFKNPDGAATAGRLIEKSGLKGVRVGGAEISKAHANFIVNIGGATSKDVMQLIELAKKKVSEKFGIDLELELKII